MGKIRGGECSLSQLRKRDYIPDKPDLGKDE